jgi:AcrR family transcriptional regulator
MDIDPKEFREKAIKDAKCALILDAARRLFAQKGYWETHLEDIAGAAGFSKASLYNYYVDKEAIFLSIVIDENMKIMKTIEAAVRDAGDFSKTLELILRIILQVVNDDMGIMVNTANVQNMFTMHANMFKHKELLELFIESVNKFFTLLEGLIRRARDAGEIASDLDEETLSRFIGVFIQGILFEWNVAKKRTDIDTTIKYMLDFIQCGVKKNVTF